MPERLNDDTGSLVEVADAIRLAFARQRDALNGTTDWKYLVPSQRAMWLELAYAAASAWTRTSGGSVQLDVPTNRGGTA